MKKWSFKENLEWKSKFIDCNSVAQSPINIDSELSIGCSTLCELKIHYKPSKCHVSFNHGLLTLKYDTGSYILYKNIYYKLDKITVHTPSLHSIDHEKYDMEICLFHNSGSEKDGGVVISCLYEEGPHYGDTENFFNQFINDTPAFDLDFEEDVEVSSLWNANMLLPNQRSFYVYSGSMPFPPCYENYHYIVMDNTNHIGATNLNLLRKYLGNNIRPIQPLNNRKVFYSSGETIVQAEREVTVSNDKFLRCVKGSQPTTTISSGPATTTTPVDNTSAFYPDTKKTIKSVFTLITVAMIMVNAFFFTKYLFMTGRAQAAIFMMVGKAKFGNIDIRPVWNKVCQGLKERDIEAKQRIHKEALKQAKDLAESRIGDKRPQTGAQFQKDLYNVTKKQAQQQQQQKPLISSDTLSGQSQQ